MDPGDWKLAVYVWLSLEWNNRRNELQRQCGTPSYFVSSIKLSVQHILCKCGADKQTINMTSVKMECNTGDVAWRLPGENSQCCCLKSFDLAAAAFQNLHFSRFFCINLIIISPISEAFCGWTRLSRHLHNRQSFEFNNFIISTQSSWRRHPTSLHPQVKKFSWFASDLVQCWQPELSSLCDIYRCPRPPPTAESVKADIN